MYNHYNAVKAKEGEISFDTATQRFIYLELCYEADRTGVVRYSQPEIAHMMLLSTPTISNQLARLSEMGLLLHEKHGRYRVMINPVSNTQQRSPANNGDTNNKDLKAALWKTLEELLDDEGLDIAREDKKVCLTEREQENPVITACISSGILRRGKTEDIGLAEDVTGFFITE